MSLAKVSKNLVRKFLISRNFGRFKPHRKIKHVEYEHILPLECVQMDPLRIVERNQDLVLINRFDNYKSHMIEKIAYDERKMIEAYFNALCFVPAEEYRYHLVKQQSIGKEIKAHLVKLAKGEKILGLVKHLKSEIEKHGALPASYFKTESRVSWGYSPGLKVTTAALDYMWYSGMLMTSHRDNGKRVYNLPERVLPDHVSTQPAGQKEYQDFMLRKHFRTYHIGDLSFWRFGNMHLKKPERIALVEPLIKKGEILELEIEGVKKRYLIMRDDCEDLLAAGKYRPDNRVRFLAPLDNLIFNRDLIKDIFGFEYAWEVYSPKSKRKYGYYVMPILYKLDFIGRIDPKADRKNSTLVFNLIQIEDGVKINMTLSKELASAALRLAKFSGLDKVDIKKTSPQSLKSKLSKLM
ncbi:MAG TPA: winged helix-turn-helix domain-containing protein [candidate division Zixibacteria bacterium]|nr:winged helix-turn-helix domain-containing protein [candidate division Zixibacteria bacterium]